MTDIIYIEDPSFENEENDLINLELYFPLRNSSIYIKINKFTLMVILHFKNEMNF